MGKNDRPVEKDDERSLLGDLLREKGFTASPTPATPPQTPPGKNTLDLSGCGKITLRRERKGRGGKTVTIVSGLNLPAPRLELLARELRKGLGCGSGIENGTVVLQGDIAPRALEWLRKHGEKQITIGN